MTLEAVILRTGPPADLRWVGAASELEPPTPGLFPKGTEILHTVRYLEPGDDGRVVMAARLKELRYLKKTSWQTYADLGQAASAEAKERAAFPDGLRSIVATVENGAFNGSGWRMQGFVEDAAGALRPQTVEETRFCVGCHGGVGAGTDSTFSFARKVPGDAGWRHERDGLYGMPDRVRGDGRGEAALYLETTGSGDDFGANDEIAARAVPPAVLAADISSVIVPSPERAMRLNALYREIVQDQSYARGRDAAAGLDEGHAHRAVVEPATGVDEIVAPNWVIPKR